MTDTANASTAVDLARAGRFAAVRELFAPSLRPLVAAEAIKAAWDGALAEHGRIDSVGEPVSGSATAGVVTVRIPVSCQHGGFTVVSTLDPESGFLVGLTVEPGTTTSPAGPWEPPDYVDPAAFDEQEVTLGAGPLAVPGTLSLPRRRAPHSGVVLLGGSGPNDRDETLGPSKMFADLALGLASRGVAVLRFDKVTHAHRDEVRGKADFTAADEYLPAATAAIRLLEAHTPGRVFLAGHSLGGIIAPRVAAAEPAVAGLILLAAGTRPIHWAIVEQIRYLSSLDPATAASSEAMLDALTKQAELVDSPDLNPATPADQLPFGTPAPYWLDLRDYHQVEVARTLDKPMLILQGGRDYQVTVAHDLAEWQAALGDRPRVTVRVHEPDNHFFFAGSSPSTPAEYQVAHHVDPAVVADIADWLAAQA